MDFNTIEDEMERRRYNAIKKSGKYIELNILIGVEKEKFDGHTGKLPVVTTYARGCGPEEIANMYLVLKSMVEYYEQEYPAECLLASLTMTSNNMGTIDRPIDEEE
jgi:hypothetical protein